MAAAAAGAEGGAGGGAVVRIFVGGISEGVAAADLEAMFATVGRVAGVEFVRTNGRGFAYVDFHCPSDKALAKLFSTYNGCKWKGGKLRLERAKEHYLTRLKREWEQEAEAAAAAQEIPASGDVESKKEKLEPNKAVLDSTKINIYFPKLRKVKALPFKGTGKHKYSFRHIEVPSYPIHFCDCEEHCGPPEAANGEYASVLNAAASEKERSIMNSVMSKLFEKENDHFDSLETQNHDADFNTTKPSDARNDLQMEETEEISGIDLDDLQMEEAEDPSEEESDDLVLNIVTRKTKSSVAQSNRENHAADMDSHFKKHQQFEESSPQKKRHKSSDFSESRNKKQSFPAMSGAIQNEKKSSGLSGAIQNDLSSKLDRDKSSASVQSIEALVDSSTSNGSEQNALAGEPKRGSLWTQKSAWRDLVGGMGSTSFSLSQILPNTNPSPPPASVAETKRIVKPSRKSSKPSEVSTQLLPGQKMQSSMTMLPSSETTVVSGGHDTGECKENNKLEKERVVPKITIGEVCPFMRNTESEQQWSKAKKVLTGFIKKGNESSGSNVGKGKPSARR
ncbi:protein REPRESSOR OF SILENCING 3 [Oryza brachyantha]|uniref:protein REPRESSOR OF SILENCING 3 n=1 Tax=Oryza brachyantha TaxID=4533 RepID=UPI001ADC5C50|nr:protein REPRESSOR OF SILENCING 3 [Oryza brachyantha]